jgi:hypothetical protein
MSRGEILLRSNHVCCSSQSGAATACNSLTCQFSVHQEQQCWCDLRTWSAGLATSSTGRNSHFLGPNAGGRVVDKLIGHLGAVSTILPPNAIAASDLPRPRGPLVSSWWKTTSALSPAGRNLQVEFACPAGCCCSRFGGGEPDDSCHPGLQLAMKKSVICSPRCHQRLQSLASRLVSPARPCNQLQRGAGAWQAVRQQLQSWTATCIFESLARTQRCCI